MLELNFKPFPVITTERLELRKVLPGDVNEIFILRSDERVMKYIDRPRAKNLDDAMAFIKKITDLEDKNDCINWAITIKGEDKLIGTFCFWNVQKENFRTEIGYALMAEHQRKGIMQEVVRALITYGFKTLGFHSLEANVNPENKASISLLEKNNFQREAYFRENFYYDGKFLDSAIYCLVNNLPWRHEEHRET